MEWTRSTSSSTRTTSCRRSIALLDGKHAGAFNLAGDGLLTWGRARRAGRQEDAPEHLAEDDEARQRALWKLHVPRTEAPAGNLDFIRLPVGRLHGEAEVHRGLAAQVRQLETFKITMRPGACFPRRRTVQAPTAPVA